MTPTPEVRATGGGGHGGRVKEANFGYDLLFRALRAVVGSRNT